jgi:hypothetical protein
MAMRGRQVFVDPTGRRWRVLRRLAAVVALLLVCFLLVLAAGAFLGSR